MALGGRFDTFTQPPDYFLVLRTSISSPFKICKYFKDFCINTLTLFTNKSSLLLS